MNGGRGKNCERNKENKPHFSRSPRRAYLIPAGESRFSSQSRRKLFSRAPRLPVDSESSEFARRGKRERKREEKDFNKTQIDKQFDDVRADVTLLRRRRLTRGFLFARFGGEREVCKRSTLMAAMESGCRIAEGKVISCDVLAFYE